MNDFYVVQKFGRAVLFLGAADPFINKSRPNTNLGWAYLQCHRVNRTWAYGAELENNHGLGIH